MAVIQDAGILVLEDAILDVRAVDHVQVGAMDVLVALVAQAALEDAVQAVQADAIVVLEAVEVVVQDVQVDALVLAEDVQGLVTQDVQVVQVVMDVVVLAKVHVQDVQEVVQVVA